MKLRCPRIDLFRNKPVCLPEHAVVAALFVLFFASVDAPYVVR
jgi:hypothetical protein